MVPAGVFTPNIPAQPAGLVAAISSADRSIPAGCDLRDLSLARQTLNEHFVRFLRRAQKSIREPDRGIVENCSTPALWVTCFQISESRTSNTALM